MVMACDAKVEEDGEGKRTKRLGRKGRGEWGMTTMMREVVGGAKFGERLRL